MFNRKVAFIDLTNRKVVTIDIPREWREKYIGGRGINTYLFYSLVKQPVDPFSPENPVIIGAGFMSGLPGFGSGRYTVTTTAAQSGVFSDGSCGGHFGPELKYTGFDHLVITGKSDVPVYLMVSNDKVEFRDASHLWGKDTWETQRIIQKENHDDRIRSSVIGPAGENLVRFATVITNLKNASGSCFAGAVMGSKKLKAVAVRGTKDVAIANPLETLAYIKEENDALVNLKWAKALHRFGTPLLLTVWNEGGFLYPGLAAGDTTHVDKEKARSIYADKWVPKLTMGMASCLGCSIHCRHRHLIPRGRFATRGEGPEWADVLGLGADLQIWNPEAFIYMGDMCNRHGLDKARVAELLSFSLTLVENGIVSKEDVGVPLEPGNADAFIKMIENLTYRKGFGDILADGRFGLHRLPSAAARYMPIIKGSYVPGAVSNAIKSWLLNVAVNTQGGHQHRGDSGIDVLGLPEDFLEKLYGGYVSSDYRSYDGKSRIVWWHELLHAVTSSLGFCLFTTTWNTPHGPRHEQYAQLLKLAADMDIDVHGSMEIGERVYTMERLILGRFGVGTREHDHLPKYVMEERFKGGASAGVPFDPDKFQEMLDEYYALHKWDSNGVPPLDRLEELGIKEASLL